MRPTTSLSTLRPDLGSMFEFDLEANRQKFIAGMVLPTLSVDLAGDSFGRIPLKELLKRADVRRGPKGDYNRIDLSFETDSYATDEYGLEGVVDQRNARKYANYIDAEASTARLVLHQVLLEAEIRVRDLLFTATTYTPTPITDEWDDYVNAVPMDDVEASVRRIFTATGIWPNTLVINKTVFRNLRLCEQVIERIHSMGAGESVKPGNITKQMLAEVFDLEEVVVSEAVFNSADEGATATPGHIWTNEYAAVGVVARSQDITEPCLGHTFHWAGDGSQPGGLMESYYHEPARSDVIRVRHDVDEKIKYSAMWDLMSNITT